MNTSICHVGDCLIDVFSALNIIPYFTEVFWLHDVGLIRESFVFSYLWKKNLGDRLRRAQRITSLSPRLASRVWKTCASKVFDGWSERASKLDARVHPSRWWCCTDLSVCSCTTPWCVLCSINGGQLHRFALKHPNRLWAWKRLVDKITIIKATSVTEHGSNQSL